MTDLDMPAGVTVSDAPIEGGVCVINAAFPPGHEEHEVWRTPTDAELAATADRVKAFAVSSRQAKRAMLRVERNRRLSDTDWTELPSATARLTPEQAKAWADYRQQLRDLPATTVDPDAPVWPAPPGATDEADIAAPPASAGL